MNTNSQVFLGMLAYAQAVDTGPLSLLPRSLGMSLRVTSVLIVPASCMYMSGLVGCNSEVTARCVSHGMGHYCNGEIVLLKVVNEILSCCKTTAFCTFCDISHTAPGKAVCPGTTGLPPIGAHLILRHRIPCGRLD